MDDKIRYHTDLFTIRIWQEKTASGQIEWRGRVQHVLSGEVRYFRGWQALIDQFQLLLAIEEKGADNTDRPLNNPPCNGGQN